MSNNLEHLTPSERLEIKKEARKNGLQVIGNFDLPERYRKEIYLRPKNIKYATYRLVYLLTDSESRKEQGLKNKAETNGLEKTTTRIMFPLEDYFLFQELTKLYGRPWINLIYMIFAEIDSNKQLYSV